MQDLIKKIDMTELMDNIQREHPSYLYQVKQYLSFLDAEGFGMVDGYVPFMNRLEKNGYYTTRRRGARIVKTHRKYKPQTLQGFSSAILKTIELYPIVTGKILTPNDKYKLNEVITKAKKKYKAPDPLIGMDKILSEQEINRLIGKIKYPWLALMTEFLAVTGLRISEMLELRLTDIEQVNGHCTISFIRKKANRLDSTDVDTDLVDRCRTYFQGQEFLFENHNHAEPGPYDRRVVGIYLSREGKRILRRKVYPHMLRHSLASRAYKRDKNVKAIQRMLGHSSASVTINMYVHDAYEWEDKVDINAGIGKAEL